MGIARLWGRGILNRLSKRGMHSMITITDSELSNRPRAAVIGVGGAGCNTVSQMYNSMCPLYTIAANTDREAMKKISADQKIYLCKEVTKGAGTGGDAKLGKKCAQIHADEIADALKGYDTVFIVAGFGGGTGTGAASVVAEICNRMGAMTFTMVIEPFSFEGGRTQTVTDGFRNINALCPNVFRFQNDRMLEIMPDVTMDRALREVNKCVGEVILDMAESLPRIMGRELGKALMTYVPKDTKDGTFIPNAPYLRA